MCSVVGFDAIGDGFGIDFVLIVMEFRNLVILGFVVLILSKYRIFFLIFFYLSSYIVL